MDEPGTVYEDECRFASKERFPGERAETRSGIIATYELALYAFESDITGGGFSRRSSFVTPAT